MTDTQKASKLEELFGNGRIKWDKEYYESNGEFGFMGQLRLLNMAWYFLHGGSSS
jgi:hypothetical protein